MARDGSGTYTNPYPNFIAGTVISSDQTDANNSDIAAALTQSIAVDGQSTVTANLPMNSKKLTGMAVGTAATDSLTLGQAQAQAFAWGGTAGGGADAITISPSPAITAYAAGQKFFWIASGSANTGAATIAISGLSAIAMQDGGAALAAGVHAAGKVFMGVLNTTSTMQIMQVQSSGDPLTISALTVNGASQFNGTIIQGVDGTGYDLKLFGDTSGAYIMWDQSADKLLTAGGALVDIVKDKLMIGGTAVTTTAAELNFNDTATAGTVVASKTVVASADKDIASFRNITLTGELDAGSLDVSGAVDIAGTTNLDAVDIDGNVQVDGTLTVGVDGTGYDVKLFGDTSGAHVLWDQSEDKLLTAGGALVDVVKDKLMIGGTAVTTTAAELNFNDTATAGTVVASKTVVASADKDIASFRNITLTGELDAGSLDVSGGADIAGQTTIQNGSAGAPSLAASADTNTGLYYPAADTVGITAGGVEQFRFGSNPVSPGSKNLIENGAMNVSQRGAITGQGGTNNVYSALDRWLFRAEGVGQARVSTQISAQSDGNSLIMKGCRNAIEIDCTTSESSVSSNECLMLAQKLEAQNLQHLLFGTSGAKDLTLSFVMKSPKAGTHCVSINQGDANRSYIAEFTMASANTFQHFSLTIPGDTSGDIDNNNGEGMRLHFPLTAGTNFHNTAGSWFNGEDYATSNQQNLLDNTSNNIYISAVQLEVGSVFTGFEFEDYTTTYAKCQRYLYRLQEFSTNAVGIASGAYMSTTVADFLVQFPVEMRAAPTLSVSAVGDFKVSANSQVNDTTAMATVYGGSTQTTILRTTTASAAGGEGALLRTDGSAGGFIQYSAEL